MRYYFDHNAWVPMSEEVKNYITSLLEKVGNPSSIHYSGRQSKRILEEARKNIAMLVKCDSQNIIFTSGATESAAMVLHKKKIKCAPIEHDCVKEWSTANINISRNGKVDIEDPLNSTLQVANSETGIIQTIPKGIYFTDAVQGFGKIFVDFSGFDFEFSAISSHKIGGPKGIGAIIAKDIDALDSFMRGGGQEFGKRSGTENLINIEGFAASIEDNLKRNEALFL